VAPSAASRPALSDEQLAELLDLIGDADSVELKLTVPESEHFAVAAALGIDPLEAEIRQVYFFDTPELGLDGHGVVVRARRIQGKAGDVIVKLRPVVPRELPKKLRRSPRFNVEVDAMPGGFVCSGRWRERVDNAHVREVVLGKRPLDDLLSDTHRDLIEGHTAGAVAPGDLVVLGPILVLKARFEPEGLGRRLVAELWMYPDNSRVLELSTKCEPREAFLAAAETRVFLSGRGVELGGEQQAKTRKALEFFAGRA
jgi:hypothetical protein